MQAGTVHIIGAGVAGLAAGVFLAREGRAVRIYETSPNAGGRCRSFHDAVLGREIDNGSHLLLGANREAMRLIRLLEGEDRFWKLEDGLPFCDLRDGERWRLPPSGGFGKIMASVPGGGGGMGLVKLLLAGRNATVASCFPAEDNRYIRLWEPLAVSILNTPAARASAASFRRVLGLLWRAEREGMAAFVPKQSWNDALIAPMVEAIRARGGELQFSRRIRAMVIEGGRVTTLRTAEGDIMVASGDTVILATPPHVATMLLPGLEVPQDYAPIVNVHFAVSSPESRSDSRAIHREAGMDAPRVRCVNSGHDVLGIIGGAAHFLFFREGLISATTSAAYALAEEEDEAIAAKIWGEVRQVCHPERSEGSHAVGDPSPLAQDDIPPYRVIKEKRATFACTPENLTRRPGTRTTCANLFLAGDYTDTGLPATIEGAVVSALRAVAGVSGKCK